MAWACSRSSTVSTTASSAALREGLLGRGGQAVGQQPGGRRDTETTTDDDDGPGRHETSWTVDAAGWASRAATRLAWVGASGTPGARSAANSRRSTGTTSSPRMSSCSRTVLSGRPGVVHEEQLALVVADVVAEAEGPLDDLLRRADGQRRLAGEVLQRRAVPVDRRVVEVRPELAYGVLAVGAHEDLAAETDDRLVGGAVAVVLEARR